MHQGFGVGFRWSAAGGDAKQKRNGQKCQVKKVCRVVCEEKAVKTPKYTVECEDFCVPGRSQKHGCAHIPTGGCVRTRKTLVKTEEVKKVLSTRCVVAYLCERCCQSCGCQVAAGSVAVPTLGARPSRPPMWHDAAVPAARAPTGRSGGPTARQTDVRASAAERVRARPLPTTGLFRRGAVR
jgi:hypothetical protein